jgi:hypothetical protein
MSVYSGPEISEDGLVFAYDMANSQKSWIGRPTTNFVNAISTPISRYNNPGFSGSVFNTGETFKGMPIWETVFIPQDSTFIPRLASAEGFGAFHAMGTSLTVNTRYMASIYFRLISPLQVSGTQGFDNTYSNISAWGQNGTTSTRYEEDGWIRLYSQFLNASSTLTDNKFWKITFDTTGVQAGQSLRAQWSCPMIEQHDTVYPSTFVNGTRSNTQAIRDLTNNNTITANSLTYASDGTFSFNGSTDFISTNRIGNTPAFTHEVFIRPTNVSKDQMYIGYGAITGHYVRIVGSRAYMSVVTTGGQQILHDPQILANNTNYHIVSSYNGVQLKIYINGILSSTSSVLNQALSGWGIDRIGRWLDADQRAFVGTIFNLKSYNRELSATEVQQNFNALRSRYGI